MYIGNQDYGLELVRDFDIENGIYHGFNDKYAASAAEQESSSPSVDMITDKRLLAVINTYKAENAFMILSLPFKKISMLSLQTILLQILL